MADSPLFDALLDPQRYQYDPRALWHFGAAAVMAACTALVLYWERFRRVSRLFAGATVLLALWSTGQGLARLLVDPAVMQALWQWI
jgi:hypothetical protein